jgi:hypothetical protein
MTCHVHQSWRERFTRSIRLPITSYRKTLPISHQILISKTSQADFRRTLFAPQLRLYTLLGARLTLPLTKQSHLELKRAKSVIDSTHARTEIFGDTTTGLLVHRGSCAVSRSDSGSGALAGHVLDVLDPLDYAVKVAAVLEVDGAKSMRYNIHTSTV